MCVCVCVRLHPNFFFSNQRLWRAGANEDKLTHLMRTSFVGAVYHPSGVGSEGSLRRAKLASLHRMSWVTSTLRVATSQCTMSRLVRREGSKERLSGEEEAEAEEEEEGEGEEGQEGIQGGKGKVSAGCDCKGEQNKAFQKQAHNKQHAGFSIGP